MSFLSKIFGKKASAGKHWKPLTKRKPVAVFKVKFALMVPSAGVFAEGEVLKGTIKENMKGKAGALRFVVSGIEWKGEGVKTALDGQECSLQLTGVKETDLSEGMVLEFF